MLLRFTPSALGIMLLFFQPGWPARQPEASGPSGSVDSVGMPQTRTKIVETEPLTIDRIYHSMTGPYERVTVNASDLGWITAIRTDVLDATDGEAMGGEFFCHSQLQVEAGKRLTVSATGAEELRFPPGFGIPVRGIFSGIPAADRHLTFYGMVLNNHYPDIDRRARIRATIEYVPAGSPGDPPIKSLYSGEVTMWVHDLERYEPAGQQGQQDDDVTTHCALVNDQPVHWMVPPGPQLTRQTVTELVPVDSTVHLAQVHMHNYGRYVRLTDRTTGDVLWQADVEYEPDRMQIARIPTYSSAEGFTMYRDHIYEIEAFYDNTSDRDVDAMALLYFYFHPLNGQELFLKPSEIRKDPLASD